MTYVSNELVNEVYTCGINACMMYTGKVHVVHVDEVRADKTYKLHLYGVPGVHTGEVHAYKMHVYRICVQCNPPTRIVPPTNMPSNCASLTCPGFRSHSIPLLRLCQFHS